MSSSYASRHSQFRDAILDATAPRNRPFAQAFYAQSTADELASLAAERAAEIAEYCAAKSLTRRPHAARIDIAQGRVQEKRGEATRTRLVIVNDDRPFLVDSLTNLMTRLGLTIYLTIHPVMQVARDAAGKRQRGKTPAHESLIYFEVSPLPPSLPEAALRAAIDRVLAKVTAATRDWRAMDDTIAGLATLYNTTAKGAAKEEAQEIAKFLDWLRARNFVFLGVGEFRPGANGALKLQAKTALGIFSLAPDSDDALERSTRSALTSLISIHKSSDASEIHRSVRMDYITIRRLDAKGKPAGEIRILGLFTSVVYYQSTDLIPFIRRKVASVMRMSGFNTSGHSGKSLRTIIEFLPRDEIFAMDAKALFAMAMGILALELKPQLRLFPRPDPFGRFVSFLVYLPRERLSTDLREQMSKILAKVYGGTRANYYTQITESPLARVQIIINTTPDTTPEMDVATLEHTLSAMVNVWQDSLKDALLNQFGEAEGEALYFRYHEAFPPTYINSHSAQSAAFDMRRMEACLTKDGLALELFRRADEAPGRLHLKCYTTQVDSMLSDIVPMLESMGCKVVDVTPFEITPKDAAAMLIRDFILELPITKEFDLHAHKARLESALTAVWRGQTSNDPLNALVFYAGLTIREIEILQVYARYLKQIGFSYSHAFMAQVLLQHPQLTRLLVDLFKARFDPAQHSGRDANVKKIHAAIRDGLEQVSNLAEDTVIRRIKALMLATLRVNYFQRDSAGNYKSYIAMKFRSAEIPELPLPLPYAEIFVTSMRMDGVHLRGGKVARGGIRWSDRAEDFRTEVLGLMKAQMVKNSVIVPQGAKGGFILRQSPGNHDALLREGIACYREFLCGLLDLTDNIVGQRIVKPAHTICYDDEDPYLVVAADKGTASFSDIANRLSADYGFWLGDAFASGGSAGYDHKEIGITARGAWVSVVRHFREMGRGMDTPFTVIGIGDMAGDVFGNGLLSSKQIQLIAAFNHRHIFLDPTPNCAVSFAERTRLFHLPQSAWTDYDQKKISAGGGVFERSAKTIALSPEARAVLGTDKTSLSPDQLIQIILKAPVDLLWNGGIGTYVKASSETDEQVGDRSNNAVRVNGTELRAKIVGEGGNLGFTQRGRIEYARAGGRLNTDAIDNSGGVDCSDHEVNIKIALSGAVMAKKITLNARNTILKSMTDAVAELVLNDNRLQTQAITLAEHQKESLLEPVSRFMADLERDGLLNRSVEFLPTEKQLSEMRGTGQILTRPELAVLLSYAKQSLYRELKESKLLDAPYFEGDLRRYFPTAMQKKFASEIANHRLRREIVATMLTNSLVNRMGVSFVHEMREETGLSAADIAQAYALTRDAFHLREVWTMIESLDGKVEASVQTELFRAVNLFIEHACRWWLRHLPQPIKIDQVMARFGKGIDEFRASYEPMMTRTLKSAYDQVIANLTSFGIPPAIARTVASLEILASACDVVEVATHHGLPVKNVGPVYFELGARLKLGWLRRTARQLATESHWERRAITGLVTELYQAQQQITEHLLRRQKTKGNALDSTALVAAWATQEEEALRRYLSAIEDLKVQPTIDHAMLIVALRQVQWMVDS
jgi:glutamate dehydrogenase